MWSLLSSGFFGGLYPPSSPPPLSPSLCTPQLSSYKCVEDAFSPKCFPTPLPPLSFSSSCSSLFTCFSFSSLLSPLSFAPPLVSSHPVLSPYSAFFSAVGVMSLCNANQLWRRQHSFSPPSPPAPLSSSSSSSFLSSPCYLFFSLLTFSSFFLPSNHILLISTASQLFCHPCPHIPSSVFVCVCVLSLCCNRKQLYS